MTLEPEHADRQRGELADALRRLRRAAGLTGAGLATRTGMSQAKVSKIENNRVRPSVVDVERILTALGISTTDDDGSRLIELARIASSDYQGFRISLQRGLGELQRDLSAIESAASTVRFFLPCMITGLLQTSEYARQTLTHPLVNRGAEWRTALARRLERQQILYRPGKRFVFVLTEGALRWPLCPPEVMALQMDRIASLSELAGSISASSRPTLRCPADRSTASRSTTTAWSRWRYSPGSSHCVTPRTSPTVVRSSTSSTGMPFQAKMPVPSSTDSPKSSDSEHKRTFPRANLFAPEKALHSPWRGP
ncbi:Scr1 family TA system antitoxin-like transcriptional regulator [Nocardiopsis alba]